ncbi:putative zinc transporter msc2 [Podila epicladia]|nr:putative zinc transporter msc2 [Podila epicladia]
MYHNNHHHSHGGGHISHGLPSGRKPGMINLDKITSHSRSSGIPFNHIAFLGIAKLIQAASAHFLREWIHVEHKPLAVVLFWMLLAASAVLLVVERPGSRPGFGTWKGQYSLVVLGGILASLILDICYAPAGSNILTIGSGHIALLGSVQLAIYQRGVARRLSAELGSMKTLHAVSVTTAAGLLGPLALIQYMISPSSGSTVYTHSPSWILYLVLGVGLFVVDFYVNQSISQRVAAVWHVLSGWPIVLISSCFTGLLLTKSIGANLLDFLIAIVMLYGIHELLQAEALNSESRFASEEGLSDDLPTHDHPSYSSLAGQYTTGGLADLGVYVKAILADQDSKQIFYFLLLNLSFMFVQMLYGVWTNSLGLISDSIHMFFDCLALGVGLFASVMSKWNANRTFTYGYNRIETLSGFSNGIFLSLISIFIVIEAIERLVHPPEMNTHRLLLVSFLGFVVNMVGIFAFNHGHAHHGHSHGHDHGHGHDHHGHNANMQGVFLHIMADTLGSVGVIISTLLIDWFGWTGFDPIASMFIAVLIFLSVIPLIKDSAAVLMLEVPDANLGAIEHALGELTNIPGVESHSCARFWPNSPESMIGSIHIQANGSGGDSSTIQHAVEQALLTNIHGLSEVSVQVEKEGMGGFQSCFCNGSSGCTNLVELNYVIPEYDGPGYSGGIFQRQRMPDPSSLGLDYLAKFTAANSSLQSMSIEKNSPPSISRSKRGTPAASSRTTGKPTYEWPAQYGGMIPSWEASGRWKDPRALCASRMLRRAREPVIWGPGDYFPASDHDQSGFKAVLARSPETMSLHVDALEKSRSQGILPWKRHSGELVPK